MSRVYLKYGGFFLGFACSFVGSEFAGETGAWIGGLSYLAGLVSCLIAFEILRPS